MEKNLDEYLDCKEYKGHPRSEQHPDFSTFEKDGEFYFAMLDEKDGVALRSEGYSSANGRDNGIESVTKNREIEERFKVIKIRGKYYLSLIAGNSQEIARSCPFASGGSAEKALLGGGKVAAAPKKRKKRRTTPKAAKIEVGAGSYPCSGISYKIFKSEGNNKHYFTYRDKNDKAILISSNIRGYDTLEETEAVIKAIAANGSKAANFEERPTTNGKFYYYLKNDDGKNIGKSFFFDTEDEMRAAMKLFDCGIVATAASAPAPNRQDDDYMVCSAYEGHSVDGDGFSRFTTNNEHYFGMHGADGSVKLRSEGYTSESGRDNGIESVKKNRSLSERYSIEEARNIFYVILKAGNHQEIGRSCPYTDRGAAEAFIADPMGLIAAAAARKSAEEKAAAEAKAKADAEAAALAAAAAAKAKQDDYLKCSEYKGHSVSGIHKDFVAFEKDGEYFFAWIGKDGEVVLRSERYQSANARDNGIESVLKNRKDEDKWSVDEKMGYYFSVLKAGNHQEIGRSCPLKDRSVAGYQAAWFAAPIVEPVAPKAKQDDYLRCSEYKGHDVSSVHKDFVSFEQDGEYFFAWIGHNGEVILRSERYQSAKARDNGIESVLKNRKDQGKWSVDEKMGYFFNVLKAGNHQEIGRSCPIKDKGATGYNPTWFTGPLAAAVATGAAVVTTKAKQDDYLKCSEYKGHKKSSVHKDFVSFEQDGEFFFAWIDKDGEVVLRSERYQSAKARDKGIDSVLRNRKQEKRWSVEEKMGYYFSVLKAANHQEIGRSCPMKEKAAAGWNPLWFAAPAAAVAVAAAAPKAPPPPPPPPPKKKKVAAATAPAVAAATSSGGFKWWWLLLPLLLLALIPFLCGKCKTETPVVPAPVEATPPPPPPVEATPPPPAPVAAVCDCNNQTNKVFKLPPANTVAKKLSKLGTNPEFGNSHSLDGAGFYNKLKTEYSAGGRHKVFLDGIFRAMGYDNGFDGASASLFTEVELPRGTKGNLGYGGKKHGTGYYELPDATRDRQAFRIEAANGCHLHFMKTCGNHMFFCPN